MKKLRDIVKINVINQEGWIKYYKSIGCINNDLLLFKYITFILDILSYCMGKILFVNWG